MRALQVTLLSIGLGVACTSELELTLEGKSCQEREPRCVAGYECDVTLNVCVLSDQLTGGIGGQAGGLSGASGGQGGEVSAGGTAGRAEGGAAGRAVGGAAGGAVGGAGAASGTGGGGPEVVDRDAGRVDASVDAGGGECTPLTVYRDGDNDGVGNVAQSEIRCPEDGWVTQPGDCRDDLPDVFPGQVAFFAEPYPDPARPAANNESFDFDCSGTEQPDPTSLPATPAPNNCNSIVVCQGSGYLPSAPLRAGQGVEPRCGSNLRRTCISAGVLGCEADDVELADSLIFRCR